MTRRVSRPSRTSTPAPLGWLRCAALAALLVGIALPAFAQKVQVRVGRGPHYVGDGIDLTVIAEGFEEEPQPDIRPPEGIPGRLDYQGVSPQVSSSISIMNGQMTRQRRVTFAYHFRFLGSRAGAIEIPGFQIAQGPVSRTTAPVHLQLREIPTSDDLDVRLELPRGPLFVGQRARVAVELVLSRDLQRDLVSYALRVPLFESSRYRFVDEPRNSGDTELQIQTPDGTLLLPARSRQIEREGKSYLVVRAERTVIPLETGKDALDPPSVITSRGTRFRRDMFSNRQATATQKLLARGRPTSIEVAELPSEGRPASFAGAIGRGYSIDVAADRSVVQVGEPIVLTFRVRGDGDLSTAALPPLDGAGLLDPELFRVPDEPPPGRVEEDGKVFEATVRVLDASVREIPALEYSWFDAGTRRFETTRSRPIALSVDAAEVIGASAVARRQPAEPTAQERTSGAGSSAEESRARPPRATSLALTGADLGVERDASVLLRDDRAAGHGPLVLGSLYALGVASIGLAVLDRRRRDVDPVVASRRRALARGRSEVEAALARPEREAAGELARTLRSMLALVPEASSAELDALLGECDARSYAPTAGAGGALPETLAQRAREQAKRLEGASS